MNVQHRPVGLQQTRGKRVNVQWIPHITKCQRNREIVRYKGDHFSSAFSWPFFYNYEAKDVTHLSFSLWLYNVESFDLLKKGPGHLVFEPPVSVQEIKCFLPWGLLLTGKLLVCWYLLYPLRLMSLHYLRNTNYVVQHKIIIYQNSTILRYLHLWRFFRSYFFIKELFSCCFR